MNLRRKGGETMIPASILTVVTAVVCKKVLDMVFDDEPKTVYEVIKDHDTMSEDIALEMVRRDIQEAEQEEGDYDSTIANED